MLSLSEISLAVMCLAISLFFLLACRNVLQNYRKVRAEADTAVKQAEVQQLALDTSRMYVQATQEATKEAIAAKRVMN